jgi:hypothetical protein
VSSSLRCLGGTSFAASEKNLQRSSIPSLIRYGDSNQRISNPLLISCHAFSTRGGRGGRPRVPRMKDLHSVEEVIMTAYEHLDVMSRRDLSAVWARIALLMTKRQPRQQSNSSNREDLSMEDMQHMLFTLFDDTTKGIKDCGARELTETILGMAKIIKILRKQGKKRGEDSSRVLLRELLLNKDMEPNEELFQFFAGKSMDKLHQFDARCLSNLAYAYALIEYVPGFDDEGDLFDHIAKQSVGRVREFEPQGYSNVVWAYATVNKPHSALFETMGDQVVEFKHLGEFKPQALKDVVWAYATAGVQHPKLFEKVANHIAGLDNLNGFKPQNLSNTVWAYATAGIPHPTMFEKVANHIVGLDSLDRFEPQNLKDTVWAYATVGISHPKMFEKVANHIVGLDSLDRFIPQELSNTVWAYATAPQNLKDTVWAYATVGISHPKMFEKVANHIVGLDSLDRFIPQELSNTVWAYATAQVPHPTLFEKVANHIVKHEDLNKFEPQALSNTLWAYATAGINHPILFEKVANHVVKSDNLDRFEPQALKDTVWAYATAQVSYAKLFHKVANAAIQRKEEFNNSQEVANLLWAYATMGIINKQLFSSFVQTAAKLIDICDNQELANIAWAYAVADVDAPTLFNNHFINKCVEKKGVFENEALFQLHQWHLWQTKEKSNRGLPTELQDKCYEASLSRDPTTSRLQDGVVAQLTSIGLDPKEEVLMDSGYRIDAIVEVNGKTIGVEVDGPSHFIGKGRSPLARTILKRRQVPLIDGIELVSLPYWEWDKLGKNEVKKQEYLQKLLGLSNDE